MALRIKKRATPRRPPQRRVREVASGTVRMSAAAFRDWSETMRAERGWSLRQCARRLGCTSETAVLWRRDGGAPHYVALACAAIYEDVAAWAEKEKQL